MRLFHSLITALTLSLILLAPVVEARSGCCSHHGGVCGCGCCDGSSLSALCAPYYPQCSNTTSAGSSAGTSTSQPSEVSMPVKTQVQALSTPRPTITPTIALTPTPTKKPTP